MKLGVFFLQTKLGGGTTTFTAQLVRALQAAGHEVDMMRLGRRAMEPRPFGSFDGVLCRTVTVDEALLAATQMPTVIGASANPKDGELAYETLASLCRNGTRPVIHDPNERPIYAHIDDPRPICIRPSMLEFYPNAAVLPHPYTRVSNGTGERTQHAISLARIHHSKRTHIILEANRQLPEQQRVTLMGAEYRLYSWGLAKRYGDVFKQCGKTFQYPFTFTDSVERSSKAHFNVDFTRIKGDGGGTQYSQLEAMDGGCVNIMHDDWFALKGEVKPGKHVLTVSGPESLIDLLKKPVDHERNARINEECAKLLKRHAPAPIGKLFAEELTK